MIRVKSIVTLLLTAVFCVQAVRGQINGEQVMTIFGTVIAFYFGTQSNKKEEQTWRKDTE